MDLDADADDAVADLDDMGADEVVGDEAGDEDEEMDLESDGVYESALNDDDIIEIDEAALVAEMQNMKKLREKKYAVGHGGHGPGDLSDFGGGKDEGEKFVDGQDLNQGDPLGSDGYLDEGMEDDDLDEGEDDLDESDDDLDENDDLDEAAKPRRSKKNKMGESRQKTGKKNGRSKETQLAEAVKAARVELAEQKLFNTKLVALNRVLQIPGLKKGQKEKVVETLDKGRTVAEVQQLYTKIVEKLTKSSNAIKESADRSAKGSSSRVVTSASSSDKGDSNPLLEKWNKIAFGEGGVLKG
jgi:hypothetical protein